MIARWPGKIAAGTSTDHISGFQDLLPTMADLIDVPALGNIDGISYLPTLLGQHDKQKKHDHLYWEFVEKGGKRALRKGDWKLVQTNIGKAKPNPIELYNLANDLGETTDVSPQYPSRLAELTEIMDAAHVPSETFPLFHAERK
jgi:arylsulfatase A-like enzyme